MFSNKEYSNKSPEAIKISNALKRIAIAQGAVKRADNEGYIGMAIDDCYGFLKELKEILEVGEVND